MLLVHFQTLTELELGHKPYLHFDWERHTIKAPTPQEQLTREGVQQIAKRAHDAVEYARKNLKKHNNAKASRLTRIAGNLTSGWKISYISLARAGPPTGLASNSMINVPAHSRS